MAVDLTTYRARIGTFGHSIGVDVIAFVCYVNFSGGLKTVGSVIFIGILLLIAGIETNPGPKTENTIFKDASAASDEFRCGEAKVLQSKLKVTQLPEDVDKEMLKALFEQTDDQGRGKVSSVILDKKRKLAVIEFEAPEAVEAILRKQPITIFEKQVEVDPIDDDHDEQHKK